MSGYVALTFLSQTAMTRKVTGVLQIISGVRHFASAARDHGVKSRSLGPAVRNLVEHYRIQTGQLHPSGPKGFVLKGDVLKFIREQNLKPSVLSAPLPAKQTTPPPSPLADKKVSAGPAPKAGPKDSRGRIKYHDFTVSPEAKNLAKLRLEGKNEIPHAYSYTNVSVDAAAELYLIKGLKSITLTDVLVRIIAVCGQRVKIDGADVPVAGGNIDLAVEAYGQDHWSYRVLEHANRLGIKDVARFMKLRSSAVELPDIAKVPCRVVSLIGSRVDQLTEILSPNQNWVITIGDIMTRYDIKTKASSRIVTLSLSYNAATISDDEANRFLGDIKQSVERPILLIAGMSGGKTVQDD